MGDRLYQHHLWDIHAALGAGLVFAELMRCWLVVLGAGLLAGCAEQRFIFDPAVVPWMDRAKKPWHALPEGQVYQKIGQASSGARLDAQALCRAVGPIAGVRAWQDPGQWLMGYLTQYFVTLRHMEVWCRVDVPLPPALPEPPSTRLTRDMERDPQ